MSLQSGVAAFSRPCRLGPGGKGTTCSGAKASCSRKEPPHSALYDSHSALRGNAVSNAAAGRAPGAAQRAHALRLLLHRQRCEVRPVVATLGLLGLLGLPRGRSFRSRDGGVLRQLCSFLSRGRRQLLLARQRRRLFLSGSASLRRRRRCGRGVALADALLHLLHCCAKAQRLFHLASDGVGDHDARHCSRRLSTHCGGGRPLCLGSATLASASDESGTTMRPSRTMPRTRLRYSC